MADVERGVFSEIAQTLGATESSIRLLASMVAGLPLGLIHRSLFYGRNTNLQNLFLSVCGLFIAYFNFGSDAVHSLANIIIIYLLLLTLGATKESVAAAFVINMVHLLYGYYTMIFYKDGLIYAITWATPHCVITLRLTGLVFDIYDGTKKKDDLSESQKESALTRIPSFLEICGFTYFFGSFLAGPQFSMRRYLDFINGSFTKADEKPNGVWIGLQRALLGALCIAAFQVSEIWLPTGFLVEDEYRMKPLWWKLGYLMLWGKFTLYKYVGVWLIAEGACTIAGLTYNGVDSTGRSLWNGCANIRFWKYETADTFQKVINAFNVNTNAWMAKYVFKRLKFLGNRNVSQCITLFYLALWHGLHTGYFNNFLLEFFIMKFETDVTRLVQKQPAVASFFVHPVVKPVAFVLKKLFLHTFLAYPLASFVLLTSDMCWKFYSSIYFIGHILFMCWPVVSLLISITLKTARVRQEHIDVVNHNKLHSD